MRTHIYQHGQQTQHASLPMSAIESRTTSSPLCWLGNKLTRSELLLSLEDPICTCGTAFFGTKKFPRQQTATAGNRTRVETGVSVGNRFHHTTRPRLPVCFCACLEWWNQPHAKRCVSGLVVEWLPATESARVRFPAHAFCKSGATWHLVPNLLVEDARALSSVEERPFRIREVEGSNPSVSICRLLFPLI